MQKAIESIGTCIVNFEQDSTTEEKNDVSDKKIFLIHKSSPLYRRGKEIEKEVDQTIQETRVNGRVQLTTPTSIYETMFK